MRYGFKVGPDGALGKSADGALHDMSRRQMAVDVRKGSYGPEGDPAKQVPPPKDARPGAEKRAKEHATRKGEEVVKKKLHRQDFG